MFSFVQGTSLTNKDEVMRRLLETMRNLSSQFQKPVTTHFTTTQEYLNAFF